MKRTRGFLAALVCIGIASTVSTSSIAAASDVPRPLHVPLQADESPTSRRLGVDRIQQIEEMSNHDVLPLPAAFVPNITEIHTIIEYTKNDNLKQPRIIGGTSTTRDRYPYAASLIDSETNRHVCGGSLIAPDIILTAGHCSGHFNAVQVGRHNILDGQLEAVLMNNNENNTNSSNNIEGEDGYEFHIVERHVVHPLHANVIRSDFAVAKLFGSVTTVQPVKLNQRSDIPSNDDMLTVMGYGIIKKDGSIINDMSNILLEANVHYMPNEECVLTSAPFKGQTVSYDGYIDDNMLCAWKLDTDACQGDSGGPLIFRDMQIGIVSWGLSCGLEAFPGVYARISEEIEWLTKQVCELSDNPPDYFNCTVDQQQEEQQQGSEVTQDVTVVVELDEKPQETAWMMELDTMNAARAIGFDNKYMPFGSYTMPSTTIVEVLSVVANKQYKFTMLDKSADNKNTKFRLCYGHVSKVECMSARRYDENSIIVCEGISRYNLITSMSCPVVLQTEKPTPRPTVSVSTFFSQSCLEYCHPFQN